MRGSTSTQRPASGMSRGSTPGLPISSRRNSGIYRDVADAEADAGGTNENTMQCTDCGRFFNVAAFDRCVIFCTILLPCGLMTIPFALIGM